MSCEAMERGSGRFENITHAADRMDEFGLKRIVHLCPQAAHYHIDYVRVGFESDVPHVLCNFSARYNLTRRMRQVREQEKFFWREIQRNTAALGALIARNSSTRAQPSFFGSMISTMRRSNLLARAAASPASPSRARSTAKPASRRPFARKAAVFFSSSTTRIRIEQIGPSDPMSPSRPAK